MIKNRQSEVVKAFGENLRKLRKARKMSQETLAWRADTELSQISRIERGIINTTIGQIFAIADALEIHPRELFDFERPEK